MGVQPFGDVFRCKSVHRTVYLKKYLVYYVLSEEEANASAEELVLCVCDDPVLLPSEQQKFGSFAVCEIVSQYSHTEGHFPCLTLMWPKHVKGIHKSPDRGTSNTIYLTKVWLAWATMDKSAFCTTPRFLTLDNGTMLTVLMGALSQECFFCW